MQQAGSAIVDTIPGSRPIWTRTGITIRVWRRRLSATVVEALHFPLDELKVARKGLLGVALEAAPPRLPGQQLRHLYRELPHLLTDTTVLDVINREPAEVGQADIRKLFEAFERVIESRHEHGGRITALGGCTYIFRHFQLRLGDGSLASESGFRTKFISGGRRTKDVALDGAGEEEVACVTFDNLGQRKEKAHEIFQGRRIAILRLLEEHLDKYEHICRELDRIERLGLAGLPSKWAVKLDQGVGLATHTIRNMLESQRLQVAVYQARRLDAHLVRPAAATSGIVVHNIALLLPLAVGTGGQLASLESLMARHYLPKSVVYACLSVLILETALNRDTLLSLKFSSVTRHGEAFRLHGVKPKTGELHTRKLFSSAATPDADGSEPFEVTSDAAVRALGLLIANCERFIRLSREPDPPLFSVTSFYGSSYPSPTMLSEKQFNEVRRSRPEWPFTVAKLRNLAAQVHYTSSEGDIFTTQALLQHENARVTAEYLNDIVIRWLHQANINRYMKMLAATILWVVDRDDLIERHQLRLFIHRPLLFPLTPGKSSGPISAVDDWISSAGKHKFTVGTDEIHHIALQHRYYKLHARTLADANPEAFLRWDLPRIVICLALRQVVSTSRHAAILTAIEEQQ